MPPLAVLVIAMGIGTAAAIAPPVGHAIKKAAVKSVHTVTFPIRLVRWAKAQNTRAAGDPKKAK